MLEDLLQVADEADCEVQLAEANGVASEDLDALGEEYEQRYARAIAGVCELRGAPTFMGGRGDPGFPAGLRCQQATCWTGPGGTIYLGLNRSNSGFQLLGGAIPRPTSREKITIEPPPG
jgi:hypothetical protein